MPPPDPAATRWIRNAADLAAFRSNVLTVNNMLTALRRCGAVLLPIDAGVGKTTLIDEMLAAVRAGSAPYDLVIYCASERSVINERSCARDALGLDGAEPATDVAVLLGRPSEQCGDLDAAWRVHERARCSALARATLCSTCPRLATCRWHEQFTTERLNGIRVVCAVQAYFTTDPLFVARVSKLVGAARVLVVIDEALLMEKPFQTPVSRQSIEQTLAATGSVVTETAAEQSSIRETRATLALLIDDKIDVAGVQAPAPLPTRVTTEVQRAGMVRFGRTFRFVGSELQVMLRSSRWREPESGGIRYVRRPAFGDADVLFAAAGVSLSVARRHLGIAHLEEFCPDVRFLHESTQINNLRSRIGAARNFRKNAPQILHTAAQLIVRLHAEGRRALVVVKKQFASFVVTELQRMLRDVGGKPFRVVPNATSSDIADGLVVPLIWYGVRGVNAYENIDAAIAVCGYNARADVIEDQLNDPLHPDVRVHLRVEGDGSNRVARAPAYRDKLAGYDELAADWQHQVEGAWAEQALGRVRFATRPRLVVFMQMGGVRFPATEFTSLAQLRRHFGLRTARDGARADTGSLVREMTMRGKSAREIATALSMSVRSVRRHRRAGGDTNPTESTSSRGLVSPPALPYGSE